MLGVDFQLGAVVHGAVGEALADLDTVIARSDVARVAEAA